MRSLLALVLLFAATSVQASPRVAVFVRHAGEGWGEPHTVFDVPTEGAQAAATNSRTVKTECPKEDAHKIQAWVPVKACEPASRQETLAVQATREGDLVHMKMNFKEPGLNFNVNASAVEAIAMEFNKLDATGTLQVKIETQL